MRGLSVAERAALLAKNWEPVDHELVEILKGRGLLTLTYSDESGEYYDTNGDGLLALRLDAAARAVSGVSA